jgi:predicted NACHT family NTPase
VDAVDRLKASQITEQLKVSQELQECLAALREKSFKRCEHIKVLDKPNALKTKDIYTEAYFYDLDDRRRDDYMTVMKELDRDVAEYDTQKSFISSLQAVKTNPRLLILGRPGAGKTSFLKNLVLCDIDSSANKCVENFGQDLHLLYLPLRVVGKHIVKYGMITWLLHDIAEGFANLAAIETELRNMFRRGKFLILLDALDETAELFDDVCKEVEEFLHDYPHNRMIITSRLSTYYPTFEGFTSLELTEFNEQQIERFCSKWFHHENDEAPKESDENESVIDTDKLVEDFLRRLKRNNLAYKMADNPLSLTYLCMLYTGNYGFAKCQAEIFKDVVDIFLRKWDQVRNIRGRIPSASDKLTRYRKFTMFSLLAYEGLMQTPTKYTWKDHEIKNWLYNFLKKMSTYQGNDPEAMIREDAEILLKVAVMDDGLLVPATRDNFAFPYISMQEYFVAEYLLQNSELRQEVIANKLFDKQWETVFLMLTELIPDADDLFKAMFRQIQKFVQQHPKINKLLTWLNEVSTDFGLSSSSWRSQIIFLDIATDLYISRQTPIEDIYALELSKHFKTYNENRKQQLDNQPNLIISLYLTIAYALVEDKIRNGEAGYKPLRETNTLILEILLVNEQTTILEQLEAAINESQEYNRDSKLTHFLIDLKNSIPNEESKLEAWQEWNAKLRRIMLQELNVYHAVEFSKSDLDSFGDFLYANSLLLKCIMGYNISSPVLRDQIVDAMLLPSEHILSELSN